MPGHATVLLGFASLLAILIFYLAASDISQNLSPQGCRMSWMSPSYVLQTGFNSSWSPLAQRYSLWLYREVGWDPVQEPGLRTDSLPVLFIPGNAGSSQQVRSIASSATRQYYSSPFVVSEEFESRPEKPLDFFAVEFNEDLSAFHGSTIESQIAYTSQAISYIISLYPPSTKIIVMGHSMGGIVATSLLPSENISTIITMSSPHTLPPARFDSRIDKMYEKLQNTLAADPTPIVSLCGGATDMMITSESCILPKPSKDVFRRTVFTSALEGSWTGVGHREMVWCHQVRWRVARAALELDGAPTLPLRALVLERWLRDGHSLPPLLEANKDELVLSDPSNVETLPSGQRLTLKGPTISKTFLLPILPNPLALKVLELTVLVSQGSIGPVSPQNSIPLRLSIFQCSGSSVSAAQCTSLKPDTLELIPHPVPGSNFPVPDAGSDESEGVVLYEAKVDIPASSEAPKDLRWIGIKVEGADGRGWAVASLDHGKSSVFRTRTASLVFGSLSVSFPAFEGLSSAFMFPNLLSNALVVYRVAPHRSSMPACAGSLFPPLIMHTSHPVETHYFPILPGPNHRILLHTHLEAPFVDSSALGPSSVSFKIYSSGETECQNEFTGFNLTIDWSSTLGRWSSRYLNTLVSWAAGVASLVVFLAWSREDETSSMPTVGSSLTVFSRLLIRYLLPSSFLLAFAPVPTSYYVGNQGNAFLASLAPLILLISSGLVYVVWWILLVLLTIFGKISILLFGSRREKSSIQRGTLLSLSMICATIFLFIPWQVAYLGCWLLHLYTCASSMQHRTATTTSNPEAIRMSQFGDDNGQEQRGVSPTLPGRPASSLGVKQNNLNHSLHLLLLMTWLLPLTAPVLAVWVRTLLTAGYTTPFDGDHNFVAVLPFLILVDFASWVPGELFQRARFEKRVSIRWLFAAVGGTAFVFGSRKPYLVLDVGRVAVWAVVICRIGRRYWGGLPWPA